MHFFSLSTLLTVSLLASSVSAHGLFTSIQGSNGVNGIGLGITDPTGKKLRLFNQTPRFTKGDNSACGSQKLDGKKQFPIDFDKAFNEAIKGGIPTADDDGTVRMTLFQVNADGAGPYTCEVSTDGQGKNFEKIEVTQNVPGVKGKSKAAKKEFDFRVKLPQGTQCNGKNGACLIRCKNALNQPFGGCAVVALGGPTPNKAKPKTSNPKTSNAAVNNAPKAVAVAKRVGPNRELAERSPAVALEQQETEVQNDDVERAETVEYKPSVLSRLFARGGDDLAKLFGVRHA